MTTPEPPNPHEPYPSVSPAPYAGQQPGPYPVAPQPAPSATLAIIGLVTAIIPCTAVIGIVLSIVALVRARRGGAGKGLAIAGIVVGALWLAAAVAAFALGFTTLWQTCSELGNGVHQVDGVTYTCDV
jgi:hypothetical protein